MKISKSSQLESNFYLNAYNGGFFFRTHFDDLASSNSAEGEDSRILSVEQISDDKLSMSE